MSDARTIIRKVAERTGVSEAELFTRSRTNRIARARQRAMYALRKAPLYRVERTPLRSYPEIGAIFDRDHTTVIWAEKMEAFRRGEAPDPRPAFRKAKADWRARRACMEAGE